MFLQWSARDAASSHSTAAWQSFAFAPPDHDGACRGSWHAPAYRSVVNRRRPALNGILAGPIDGPEREAASYPAEPARPGLRVLHRSSGFAGALVALDGNDVVLRGQTGLERRFPNHAGAFAVDGTAVRLVEPATDKAATRTSRSRPRVHDRAHSIRQSRRRRRTRTGRTRRADPGRRGARRRADREGLGRRPAYRGCGRRAPRRRRQPAHGARRIPARAEPPGRSAPRSSGCGHQGSAPCTTRSRTRVCS